MRADALHAIIFATQREQQISRSLEHANGYDAVMSPLPDKLGALRAATAALESTGVPYALIGGLAVGIRSGVPRATLDVNLAIPSTAAFETLVAAFAAAGLELRGKFAHSVNFVHESGEPVQLAFDAGFDPMIARAEIIDVGGLTLRVVTLAGLITMKRRAAADPGRRRSKAYAIRRTLRCSKATCPNPTKAGRRYWKASCLSPPNARPATRHHWHASASVSDSPTSTPSPGTAADGAWPRTT